MTERVETDVTVEMSCEEKGMLRELPRKRLLLVAVIVLLNLCVVAYLRGRAIGRERFCNSDECWRLRVARCNVSMAPARWKPSPPSEEELQEPFVGPWDWSRDEWAEAVWPWS